MTSDTARRAIITGASSGIGRATAKAFAQAGFDVGLVSRSGDKLQALAQDLSALGIVAKAYPLDLADLPQVRPHIQHIIQDLGSVDGLVNCAGMGYTGSLATTPLSDWQQVMDINLTSVLQCIQAVLPAMRAAQGGTIVNVSSIAATSAFPEWGAYTVSKAGLAALSRVLSAEERGHGIRVVNLSPGAVNTPIWDTDTVQADFDRSKMLTPDIVAQTILSTVLLPDYAVIEELTLMPSAGAL